MIENYRNTVIESLKKIDIKNAYSNIVINNDIKKIRNELYHGLYRITVLGVIENRIFLDWVINQYSKTKTKKMQIDLLEILRIAVFQLFFLDKSNEKKVVNESVEITKKRIGNKASKFTNAVIRNIIRNKKTIIEKLEKLNTMDYYSIKYSYPRWIVDKWIEEYGINDIEEVLKANNARPLLNIRVNTLKTTKQELIKKLKEKGFIIEETKFYNMGLCIKNPHKIEELDEYKEGLFSIQSESSMLVAKILSPKKGSFLIDICAAPGGKSFHAAELMENEGYILSRDLYKQKVHMIEKGKERLGIDIIKTEEYDALEYDERLLNKVDYCIVDVPCTGFGIIRRKPEIKYAKTNEDIKNIVEIQYKILENASRYLKKGGELVYSTCTTTKEENINIISKFMKQNNDFTLVNIEKETNYKFSTVKNGYVQICPHIHNIDGFFIAKLRKI